MTTPTNDHAAAAAAAESANTAAALLWGQLEAAERNASAAWAAADHAARQAGDHAAADHARQQSRRHWKAADNLARLFDRR